jgi:hypothetical protein
VRRTTAELVAERDDLSFFDVWSAAGPIRRMTGDRIEALDAALRPVASVPGGPGRLLTATADLASAVWADETGVTVRHGGETRRIPVDGADSAARLADGNLVLIAPELVVYLGNTIKDRHRVLLVGPGGDIVDEAVLPVADAGATARPHPYDGSAVICAGEGQDGSQVFRVRVAAGRLAVEPLAVNEIALGFSPDGDRPLMVNHPCFDGTLRLVDWPGLGEHARWAGRPADHGSGFLDSDRLLVGEVGDGIERLLICAADLGPHTVVELPDLARGATVEALHVIDRDTFGVDLWRDGRTTAATFRLPAAG